MSSTSSELVDVLRSWIGTPFHHRAAQRGIGCDCFGLVYGVLAQLGQGNGLVWPDYGTSNATNPHRHVSPNFFARYFKRATVFGPYQIWQFRLPKGAWHLGLSRSSNSFVHAHSTYGVMTSELSAKWRPRVFAAYNIFKEN